MPHAPQNTNLLDKDLMSKACESDAFLSWGFDDEQEDDDGFQMDMMFDGLTELMKGKQSWFAEVHDFGWKKAGGFSNFKASTGREFMSAILPKADCSFKIHRMGDDGFAIQNFHHDSPVGEEWYYVVPAVNPES